MLGFQLRRASVAVMNALAEELAPLELNPGEASLLLLIGANSGVTQSDIGRTLRAQPANLVPLINKLTMMGIVERVPGKGRAIALSLSEPGRALHTKVTAAFGRHEARISRRVPKDQREAVIETLRRICEDSCCP
ncbi:MarR family transcriptional regulator [Sphingomonas sp. G-3-2-10]|nr:MarR family transcriptional regulator [Sphingomonas sp. G-3-2-10]NML05756.1 MarR family transcriptional regulator [Sphingomonas sp. G-3-2-10]